MPSTNAPDNAFVEMGVLTKPQGLKGEIRVHYYGESVQAVKGDVYLQAGNTPPRKVTITSARIHQAGLVIAVQGIADRNAAEALRGQILLLPCTDLPEPDDDEVYLHDMLGLAVVLHPTGEPLGTLDHVHFHGEQELWSIVTPEGKEILFPAVPDFVNDIDLEAEIIRISPPPGLLELYL